MNRVYILILYIAFVVTGSVVAIVPTIRVLHNKALTDILNGQFDETE